MPKVHENAIYTMVVVYGHEYYFGVGIQHTPVGWTMGYFIFFFFNLTRRCYTDAL